MQIRANQINNLLRGSVRTGVIMKHLIEPGAESYTIKFSANSLTSVAS